MSEDMVERVARALADEARFMYERDPERWTGAAIAAIKAMREMTVEMQVAIHNALEQHTGTMFHDPQITAVAWHAGTDAALTEKDKDDGR